MERNARTLSPTLDLGRPCERCPRKWWSLQLAGWTDSLDIIEVNGLLIV
jgi:hypothetical protein